MVSSSEQSRSHEGNKMTTAAAAAASTAPEIPDFAELDVLLANGVLGI